jgi:subtilisin family serine protease
MLGSKNSKYKLLILILITGILLSIIPSNNAAILFNSPKKDIIVQEFTKNKDKGNYKSDQLIVKINDNDYNKLEEKYDVEITKLSEDTYTVNYDNEDYSMDQMMTLLNEENIVEYAEPNYVFSVAASMTTEPLYNQQWGLSNTNYGINVVPVWNDITDQNEIVVAVVDTGANYNHQDLTGRIWSNTDEVQGNGLDDDHNGYIDDYQGWNFSASNNNVMDNEGHGSHVSGIIGAGINNLGVAGVVPNVKIMALKVTDDGKNIYLDDIIEAVHYATANGVKIFNFSFGSTYYIQSFYDLIAETNALFVCAAGNGDADQIGDNNDVYPFYPASYNLDNIISVAALNNSGNLTSFSNYGQTSVDLAAPGSGILSTHLSNSYYYMDGTSMATPFVTGAAAILYSENPTINMGELKAYLLDGVKKIPSLSTKVSTAGILNVTGSYNLLKDIVTFDGGDGSTGNPYLISNAKQLNAIRNDLDASYKLTANIDLKYDGINQDMYPDTIGWLPIGTNAQPFTGTLDGSKYKIINLTINRPDMSYVGLFGYVVGSGIINSNISNLEISANSIVGKDYVGTLSGYGTNAYLNNITVTTSISSNNPTVGYIGGVIGYLQTGLIKESYVSGSINTNANYVGGITGYIEGNINLCYNESTILGNSNIGGLAGYI